MKQPTRGVGRRLRLEPQHHVDRCLLEYPERLRRISREIKVPGARKPQWASIVRCECPANDHFCRMARKAARTQLRRKDSQRRVFGKSACGLKDFPSVNTTALGRTTNKEVYSII